MRAVFKTGYGEHADRYGIEGTLRHSTKHIRRIAYHIRRIIPNKECQLNWFTYLKFRWRVDWGWCKTPPPHLILFLYSFLLPPPPPPWVPKLTVLICLAREQPKGRQILAQTSSSIRSLLCPIPTEMGVTPGQTEYWMVNVYFHIKNNLWSMCVFYNNTIVCITL